ncbi:hypothetical protein [Desulfatitalea alkaliphila]|uniref:Uncharacterized protein n=1 Tax=Desulfatitalea alkaliphila TaxID=2929485 RepID=A0AA41RBS1_9BACT|nr:hypothetical protein [Desulfatitalea alkaliphila]MCJ8502238.1 hypothetical protein [Desulfatitalea alkaliphila]
MIAHPFTWTFWAAVATGLILYGAGVRSALAVAWHWSPGAADGAQLRRERNWEMACLLGRWALAGLTGAALLWLVGVVAVWHGMVPGAMCGTGVLQAMGGHGVRAMAFWAMALLALHGWRVLDRLDSHHPDGLLTPTAARVLLLAAPLLVPAVIHSWLALMHIDPAAPVSCCAAVYDQVLRPTGTGAMGRGGALAAGWLSLAGGGLLAVLAGLQWRCGGKCSGALPAVVAAGWVVVAAPAVKHLWSAYYYQVLSHPCPWCLFLPDHYGAGFAVYGAMAVTLTAGVTLWTADRVRRRHPLLSDAATTLMVRAARRMLLALLLFILLTAGPALAWKLRTGLWL